MWFWAQAFLRFLTILWHGTLYLNQFHSKELLRELKLVLWIRSINYSVNYIWRGEKHIVNVMTHYLSRSNVSCDNQKEDSRVAAKEDISLILFSMIVVFFWKNSSICGQIYMKKQPASLISLTSRHWAAVPQVTVSIGSLFFLCSHLLLSCLMNSNPITESLWA